MTPISTKDASYRKYLPVLGTAMADVDVDVGAGEYSPSVAERIMGESR
jgi:hypothetical protein